MQVLALPDDPPALADYPGDDCPFRGAYRIGDAQRVTINCADAGLISQRQNRPPAIYRAEWPDIFFLPGQPRTRRIFLRNESGDVIAFVDRREGHDIRWERE